MKKWTIQENQILLKYFSTGNLKNISHLLNRTIKSIRCQASILNISRKYRKISKYNINFDFFETWSPDLFYLIGYMMADGSVKNNELRLECSTSDKTILQFAKSKICQNKEIVDRKRIIKNGVGEYSYWSITDIRLKEKLKIFNLISNKTGKEKLPIIPEEFKGDYLRGLFDGDGCLYIKKYNNKIISPQFSIVSHSLDFLKELQNLYQNLGNIYKSNNSWCIKTSAKNNLLYIFNLMYSKGGFKLERKYNKFLELGFSL